MRFSQQFRMSLTRRGEKELRLGDFIARSVAGLGTRAQGADADAPGAAMLVIARSAQSPVVKSIASLAHDIVAAGCRVRLLVAKSDPTVLPDSLIAMRGAALDLETRVARDARLIEAHEQLVLGAHATWTGDTMRRDPATCDAYESFVEDAPQLAAAARTTFQRLWSDGEPLSESVLLAGAACHPRIAIAAHLTRRS